MLPPNDGTSVDRTVQILITRYRENRPMNAGSLALQRLLLSELACSHHLSQALSIVIKPIVRYSPRTKPGAANLSGFTDLIAVHGHLCRQVQDVLNGSDPAGFNGDSASVLTLLSEYGPDLIRCSRAWVVDDLPAVLRAIEQHVADDEFRRIMSPDGDTAAPWSWTRTQRRNWLNTTARLDPITALLLPVDVLGELARRIAAIRRHLPRGSDIRRSAARTRNQLNALEWELKQNPTLESVRQRLRLIMVKLSIRNLPETVLDELQGKLGSCRECQMVTNDAAGTAITTDIVILSLTNHFLICSKQSREFVCRLAKTGLGVIDDQSQPDLICFTSADHDGVIRLRAPTPELHRAWVHRLLQRPQRRQTTTIALTRRCSRLNRFVQPELVIVVRSGPGGKTANQDRIVVRDGDSVMGLASAYVKAKQLDSSYIVPLSKDISEIARQHCAQVDARRRRFIPSLFQHNKR